MESRSWSLRLVMVLAVATALWVGAATLSESALRARAARPFANAGAPLHPPAAAPAAR